MLDLKALEQELDALLEKETTESLSSWLFNRRTKNKLSSIDKEVCVFSFNIMGISHSCNSIKYSSKQENNYYDGDCLSNAA